MGGAAVQWLGEGGNAEWVITVLWIELHAPRWSCESGNFVHEIHATWRGTRANTLDKMMHVALGWRFVQSAGISAEGRENGGRSGKGKERDIIKSSSSSLCTSRGCVTSPPPPLPQAISECCANLLFPLPVAEQGYP